MTEEGVGDIYSDCRLDGEPQSVRKELLQASSFFYRVHNRAKMVRDQRVQVASWGLRWDVAEIKNRNLNESSLQSVILLSTLLPVTSGNSASNYLGRLVIKTQPELIEQKNVPLHAIFHLAARKILSGAVKVQQAIKSWKLFFHKPRNEKTFWLWGTALLNDTKLIISTRV